MRKSQQTVSQPKSDDEDEEEDEAPTEVAPEDIESRAGDFEMGNGTQAVPSFTWPTSDPGFIFEGKEIPIQDIENSDSWSGCGQPKDTRPLDYYASLEEAKKVAKFQSTLR